MPTRIVVLGDVGESSAFHVGDEAMFTALLDTILRIAPGEVFVTAMSVDPATTAERYGIAAVGYFGFAGQSQAESEALLQEILHGSPRGLSPVSALDQADLVVVSGGGNLTSSWPSHIYERVAVARLAKRRGIPLVVLGQSIGPWFEQRDRGLVAELLTSATLVTTREAASFDLARDLGVHPSRLFQHSDEATSLAPRKPAQVPSKPFLALTIDEHLNIAAEATVHAVLDTVLCYADQQNLAVVLVPHTGDLDHRATRHDVAVGVALLNIVEARGLEAVLAPIGDVREAAWWSSEAEVVVSSRYHPIVFALAAATPSIFLSQDSYTAQKGVGVLSAAGAGKWHWSVDQPIEQLQGLLCELSTEARELRALLEVSAANFRRKRDLLDRQLVALIAQEPLALEPKLAAGTIVARNYLAQARVLAATFHEHYPSSTFFTLILDGPSGAPVPPGCVDLSPDDVAPAELWHQMATIYTVMEFATAMKPAFLNALLDRDVDHAWYVDPDIMIFDRLQSVTDALIANPIALTPHALHGYPRDGETPDEAVLKHAGLYNLGFIGVSQGARRFLVWWQERLQTDATVDLEASLFTDQRWVDFVPTLFPCSILRDPSLNLAYWNLHERPLKNVDGIWRVGGRRLGFFHFSGYNPERPDDVSKHAGAQPRVTFEKFREIRPLFDAYAQALSRERFGDFAQVPYGLACSSSGVEIDGFIKEQYRLHLLEGTSDLPDPFDGTPDIDEWLDLTFGRNWRRFTGEQRQRWFSRPDLRAAFPDVFGRDATHYLQWIAAEPTETKQARQQARQCIDDLAAAPRGLRRGGWNVVGYMSAEKGMGEAGRRVAEAVKGTGLPVHVVRRSSRNTRQEHPVGGHMSEDMTYRNSILVVNADQVAVTARSLGLDPNTRGRTIGVWFWELEQFPSERWPGVFDYVDEIWAGSDFLKKSFSKVAPVPVERITLEVPVPTIAAGIERHHVGLDDAFTFLFTFDANSVMARKNPHGVIDAYRAAFSEHEGTKLLIRTVNGHRHPRAFHGLVAQAEDRSDICVVDQWLTAPLAQAQLALTDCFVSLHRSEGFGYNIAGAMAAGTPTIATGYSGNLDYMTPENSWLIPASMVPVGPGATPYEPTAIWAAPDLAVAAQAMREVFQNYDEAKRRASLGQEHLRAAHSYDAVVQGIARILARHARDWN